MRSRNHRIVIVGGGVTGMWLAKKLTDMKVDFLLVSSDLNGGLLTQKRSNGFTFDSSGGHVYGTKDERVSDLMGKIDSNRFDRKAYYRHGDRFVDYPVQDHAEDIGSEIVATPGVHKYKQQSLEEYALPIFGRRFFNDFFGPFNHRVWKTVPYQLDSDWTEGRVKITKRTDSSWGSNAEFFYATGPLMFDEIRKSIPDDHMIEDVVLFPDIKEKKLILLSGEEVHYETLIWTPSLKFILPQIDENHLQFRTTRIMNVCIGLNRKFEEMRDFHWFYPDVKTSDYHRVNKLSNYHRSLTPEGCDSFMLEQTFSSLPPLRDNPLYRSAKFSQDGSWIRSAQIDKDLAVSQLQEVGISSITAKDIKESLIIETPGYPIPTIGIRSEVARIKKILMKKNVVLAGRFGSHAYFNVDHCMTEAETIARLLEPQSSVEFIVDTHDYLYSSMYYGVYKGGKTPEDYSR